jgi:hypothetical protein
MPERALTLTPPIILGLFFLQRYRFLTIAQFSTAAGVSKYHGENVLHSFARRGIVGTFGNVMIPGHGKTPKVYFLKRKGWELLRTESDIPEELIGNFAEVHQEASWSPQMYHRLRLLDLFIALELSVRGREHISLIKTFLEYKRIRKNGRLARETTDFVAAEEIPENRIIPDGAFVLENVETGRRALFFIEMDMATERVVTQISHDRKMTLKFKFEQYDRYLQTGRFAETYARYGQFQSFQLLFVTYGAQRIETIRQALADLPEALHPFYRFAEFDRAAADLLGPVWLSRCATDQEWYRLTRN